MDYIAQLLWLGMFFTPLVTVPVAWKIIPANNLVKVLVGLLLALLLSFLMGTASILIVFRNGMGD